MGRSITDKLWCDFYTSLDNSSCDTINDGIIAINTALSPLADAIDLARIEYSISISPSAFFPNGQTQDYTVYQSTTPIHQYNPFSKNIITKDRKKIIISAFVREGFPEWDNEDKKKLTLICNSIHAVIERIQLSEVVASAVSNDMMTGLLNMDSLMNIGFDLERRKQLAGYCACMFNLKNFKYVNQILPYHDGNRIMINYCHVLCQTIEKDEHLARVGGDNFAGLIKTVNINHFLELLHKLEVSVQTRLDIKTFTISASCGYAEAGHEVNSIQELLQFASDALHVAKNVLHEDVVRYTNDIKEFVVHERSISILFKPSAYAQEFIPYYQPRIDTDNNSIVSNEALVRWVHSKNVMLPEDFIPTLERDGSIEKLDYIMLEQVCINLAELIASGRKPYRTTVNFSCHHLMNPHFTSNLIDILAKYNVSPRAIEIEFSEAMSELYLKKLSPIVNELKIYGFFVSIDHFGDGPASLHLLKDIPIDTLVFSRRFLLENYTSIQGSLLIESAVNIAKSYFVKTVACGIDSTQLMNYIKDAGFDAIQGNILNAPVAFSRTDKMFL